MDLIFLVKLYIPFMSKVCIKVYTKVYTYLSANVWKEGSPQERNHQKDADP